ncbi:hypothetical protein EV137_1554 [Kribbella pratensis]|jgi:hypothetical protein|uniref:Uncharacterized protein n=1 Tax=Kribbella pratensis TaxID=2512112 RepID=A0ABY2FNC1_9ACTN|nr:hypothetical protein [Kribbella pratensis]TDW94252.1 hypothetical protein EV137_1554 [Kribbella pratensis]
MESPYTLPNGLIIRVVDTATAGRALGNAVQSWHEGATEPLFYGSEGRPEGVVISFDQWAEYVTLKEDAEDDRRRLEGVRRRLANTGPEDYVSFEDAAREGGWDLDVPPGPADDPDSRP